MFLDDIKKIKFRKVIVNVILLLIMAKKDFNMANYHINRLK